MKNTIIKKSMKLLVSLFIIFGIMANFCTSVYALDFSKWETKADMLTAVTGFGSIEYNGKIYVFGGKTNSSGNITNETQIYDIDTDTWSSGASMDSNLNLCSAIEVNGIIYVMGGSVTTAFATITKANYAYNPETDTWSSKCDVPFPVIGATLAVVDGKIYLMGGKNNSNSVQKTTYVYDPITDTWEQKANMPYAKWQMGAVTVDNMIYTMGGIYSGTNVYTGVSTVEMYDPSKDTWTAMPSMNSARTGLRALTYGGKIYALGGYTTPSVMDGQDSIEEYDPTTKKWTTVGTLNTEKGVFGACIYKNSIYAYGGLGTSLNTIYNTIEQCIFRLDDPILSASALDRQVRLSWTSVKDAVSYNVYRSTTAGGAYVEIASGIMDTTYTDTDVTNGTTYYYVVTAVDSFNTESDYSNEASATPQATSNPNQPTGNKALLVITMVTGERKEYEMTTDKINDFITWYNSKAASSPTYAIEKDYNKASFTARKDYIVYEQISNFEVNEYNN